MPTKLVPNHSDLEVGVYSREDKLRAIELFIKYDLSPTAVIREIGYPIRGTLSTLGMMNTLKTVAISRHQEAIDDTPKSKSA